MFIPQGILPYKGEFQTFFMFLCFTANIAMLKIALTSKNLDINKNDSQNRNALFYCLVGMNFENFEFVSLLVKSGIDVNTFDKENNYSPLMICIQKHYNKIGSFLFENGASIDNIVHQNGNSPLHIAVANDNVEMVRTLCSTNLLKKRNFANLTPYCQAKLADKTDIMNLLLNKKASPKEKQDDESLIQQIKSNLAETKEEQVEKFNPYLNSCAYLEVPLSVSKDIPSKNKYLSIYLKRVRKSALPPN